MNDKVEVPVSLLEEAINCLRFCGMLKTADDLRKLIPKPTNEELIKAMEDLNKAFIDSKYYQPMWSEIKKRLRDSEVKE